MNPLDTGQVVTSMPDIKIIKHISEKSTEEVRMLQRNYPTLINNPDQTFGNIPSGKDFALVSLRQKRLAIIGRARMGRVTLRSIQSQHEAEYIARMETLRGKDGVERWMMATTRTMSGGEDIGEVGKGGIRDSIRKHIGI